MLRLNNVYKNSRLLYMYYTSNRHIYIQSLVIELVQLPDHPQWESNRGPQVREPCAPADCATSSPTNVNNRKNIFE
jgi:hypothetical protein